MNKRDQTRKSKVLRDHNYFASTLIQFCIVLLVSADSVLTAFDRKYSLQSLHELTYRETSSPNTPFLHKCKIVVKMQISFTKITKYHINLTNTYNLFLPQNKNCCFICRFFNWFKSTDLNYLCSNIGYYLLPFCV